MINIILLYFCFKSYVHDSVKYSCILHYCKIQEYAEEDIYQNAKCLRFVNLRKTSIFFLYLL